MHWERMGTHINGKAYGDSKNCIPCIICREDVYEMPGHKDAEDSDRDGDQSERNQGGLGIWSKDQPSTA